MHFRGGQLDRGSVIAGYRIDDLISRGGMGVVYRVTNLALNRIYALKVLAPELSHDQQFQERFRREMRVAASLYHTNIVAVHYAGEYDGQLFLVMDFVHGRDLRQILRTSGALGAERAVALLAQLASALDVAHAKGLVHRDVKPANVLITVRDGEERVYLTDFGLAKRSDTVGSLTQKGAVVGTVDYMSPEQITGGATDARTDIYALGCTFFHMLTGNVPYERDNSLATLFAHVHDPPPGLVGELVELYPTFGAVIEKAMAKEPEGRYLSAGDFARDASAALKGMRFEGPARIVATGEATPAQGRPQVPAHPGVAAEPTSPALPATESGAKPPAADTARQAQEPTGPDQAQDRAAPTIWASRERASPDPPAGQTDESPGHRAPGRGWARYRWPVLAGLVVVAAAIAVVIALSTGGSSTGPVGQRMAAAVRAVPTNRVTGSGTAKVQLQGNVATVTVDTNGLLRAVHLMHIHGGTGNCPPASAAQRFHGQPFISASVGDRFYGPVVESLTHQGDTSPALHLVSSLYPAVGDIRYTRKFNLAPGVSTEIRQGLAVVVVHGIDYNGNGIYDNSLGPGAEAGAPALCGALFPAQTASTGRHGSPATLYTASLALYRTSPSERASAAVLLCHLDDALVSRPSTPAESRARAPA
jgi:hypothetical protein